MTPASRVRKCCLHHDRFGSKRAISGTISLRAHCVSVIMITAAYDGLPDQGTQPRTDTSTASASAVRPRTELIIDHYHKKKTIRQGLHWHELMVRLTGPIVRELDAVFVTDWYSETDELLPLDTSVRPEDDSELVDAQILPSGPSFDNDNNLKLFAAMIHNTPSGSHHEPVLRARRDHSDGIGDGRLRGLDIELFVLRSATSSWSSTPSVPTTDSYCAPGVKIYLYRAPTILHAKHLRVDDDVAAIGSSNMDIRSLSLHMELMVLVHGARFTRCHAQGRGRLQIQESPGHAARVAQSTMHRASLRQPDADDIIAAMIAARWKVQLQEQTSNTEEVHMADESMVFETVQRYFEYTGADVDHAQEIYHDDAVLEFPQSRERFEGVATFTGGTGSIPPMRTGCAIAYDRSRPAGVCRRVGGVRKKGGENLGGPGRTSGGGVMLQEPPL